MKLKYFLIDLTIIIVIVLLILTFISGAEEDKKTAKAEEDKYMIVISRETQGLIMYDRRTKVQYWMSDGGYNSGTLIMLVDEHGNPLLYKGD